MAKIRYQLNTKSLRIEPVKVTWKQRIKLVLPTILLGIVVGFLTLVLAYRFIPSPREKALLNEIEQYKLQYKVLNRRMTQFEKVLADLQDRDGNIYRVLFDAEPAASGSAFLRAGEADRYKELEKVTNSELIKNTAVRMDQIAGQLYSQTKSFDQVFKMAKEKEQMIASIPAIQPVDYHDLRRIGSYFGYRTDPFYKVTKFHEGMDFTGASGTKIYATGDGVIVEAEYNRGGYGNSIKLNHGYGYETVYAHLSGFKVRVGQKVKRGEVIGFMGNTGKSTAPHLHYEVHKNGQPVNPIYFFFNDITPNEYADMIEQSKQPSQTMD